MTQPSSIQMSPNTKRQLDALHANLERLELLDDILDVVLDTDLDDMQVGGAVRALGPSRLANAVRNEAERPPRDGGHLELMEARFSHVRSFAPQTTTTRSPMAATRTYGASCLR
jgi:hypothetical protein